MKIVLSFFFIILVSHYSLGQEKIYLDEDGNKVNQIEFRKKWSDKELLLSRWDSIGKNKKRYATLKKDLYQYGNFTHSSLITELEKITGKKIQDSLIIILEFYYKDDLCNSVWDNKWTKSDIKERKEFITPIRDYLYSNDMILFCLFEKTIQLKNNPNSETEFFFSDLNSFFRNKIFLNPTLCGSHAIIKPNGEVLVRNGENRADYMTGHLKPEIWNRFFNDKEGN